MALSENGRSVNQAVAEEPVSAILRNEPPYTHKSYYLDAPKIKKIDLSKVLHVEDINACVADILEAEASKKTTVKKPLARLRRAAALGVTLLGDV